MTNKEAIEYLELEAQEKRIPKKPNSEIIATGETYDCNVEYYCPNCDAYLTSDYEAEYYDYCSRCRQRIDWSEEND